MANEHWSSSSCLRCFYYFGDIRRLVQEPGTRNKRCPVCEFMPRDENASVWVHTFDRYFAAHGIVHPVCQRTAAEQAQVEATGSALPRRPRTGNAAKPCGVPQTLREWTRAFPARLRQLLVAGAALDASRRKAAAPPAQKH
jgi:hypothetical protein